MAEDARTADALVFRARKRRRVEYPRRDDDEPQSEVDDLKLAPGFPISPSLPESHDGTVSAPESDDTQKLHGVLRPRKLKPRWQGLIASSHASPSPEHGTSDSRAIVLANKSSDGNPSNGAIAKRFTKQTGRTVNKLEEKHEDEFIDRRLAELNGTPLEQSKNSVNTSGVKLSTTSSQTHHIDPHFHPSQIQEVDPSSLPQRRWGNEPRASQQQKNRKSRRGPPEPTEEDLARQAALESVLADASLDYYSKPAEQRAQAKGMDEVLAAEFEQEYREQQEQRRQRQPPVMPGKNVEKGPKLGGSRSQRAQAHAQGQGKKPAGGVMPT